MRGIWGACWSKCLSLAQPYYVRSSPSASMPFAAAGGLVLYNDVHLWTGQAAASCAAQFPLPLEDLSDPQSL